MCSGVHRGLGVHISFVRSVTMDTWYDLGTLLGICTSRNDKQIKKMECGGNANFAAFLREYVCVATLHGNHLLGS